MTTSDQYIATWRDTLASQHFEHALTKIRTALTDAHLKLRALQRNGTKFSPRVQWCLTALNVITAAVNTVGREHSEKPWEQEKPS